MQDLMTAADRTEPIKATLISDMPPRAYRIRFLSREFSHVGAPEFPYVPTRLMSHGIEYTAVVTTGDHPQEALTRNFPDARVTTIEENGDFLEDDAMAGHQIRGFVPAPAPRNFWQRVLRLR